MTDSEVAKLEANIRKEVKDRDLRDSLRDICPTEPAKDAIIINNDSKTLTQVVKNMYDSAADRGLV